MATSSIWRNMPVLLSFLVGLLLGLIGRATQRITGRPSGVVSAEPAGDMLMWMLVLAAFVVGVFVTYIILRP